MGSIIFNDHISTKWCYSTHIHLMLNYTSIYTDRIIRYYGIFLCQEIRYEPFINCEFIIIQF